VRCGGQSGVDRAALHVASALNLRYVGWCPAGGWAEDCPTPPGIRALYPELTETPSSDPRQRTAWNVRDSDATLIVTRDADLAHSPGTAFTRGCAELIFEKPFHVAVLPTPQKPGAEWLVEQLRRHRDLSVVLNIAGPRESEHPGIFTDAVEYLTALLGTVRAHLS
jgi:hypothetical protein